jgi:hypothetical protein|tara:strand:+ start:1359 stop:2201 length:843 start_codon:yes stop_codon:yes gene_type:complete
VSDLYLCSFASPDLKRSVRRFKQQSKEMNVYKDIKVYGLNDLSEEKKKQIQSFRIKRLYGYASWKPEIILNFIKKIPENSILQYSDIGCHFNTSGSKRLKEYIEISKKEGILGFQYKTPNFKLEKKLKFQIYLENEYTKSDLFNFFNLDLSSPIVDSQQVWSGTMFFKNDLKTKNFLRKWLEICNVNHLVDDSPSKSNNHNNFIEHRHDQSVFSILCKINNVYLLSASECEWAEDENGRYWKHLINYPVLAKRDKKMNIFKRFYLRQIKNINRILKKCKI